MPHNPNVIWILSSVDGRWPRCEMPGCPDRFMDKTGLDVHRHFDCEHPEVTAAES